MTNQAEPEKSEGEPEKSEAELDEEAVERFDDESMAPAPEVEPLTANDNKTGMGGARFHQCKKLTRSILRSPVAGAVVGVAVLAGAGITLRKRFAGLKAKGGGRVEQDRREKILEAMNAKRESLPKYHRKGRMHNDSLGARRVRVGRKKILR